MRRLMTAVSCLAASLAFAGAAWAGPVASPPAQFSDDLQERLQEDYGEREAAVLQNAVHEALARALARVGGTLSDAPGAPVTIEVTIVDAKPNKPTFAQLGRNVGLSYADSLSIGGAELTATIRGADGALLAVVEHEYFQDDIRWVVGSGTWSDAQRAIRRFADRVAQAYAPYAERGTEGPTSQGPTS